MLHSREHVDAATQLAECGNSGNASEPHVHFQLMDRSGFRIAAGLASPVPIPGIDQSDQLAEEIGFTGFLQHHWQDRYHPMKLTVYVALLWALWHVPDHFGEEGWGVEQLIAAPVVFAIGFVSLFFARALLVQLYNRTGSSVLLVAIFHASFDAAISRLSYDVVPALNTARFLIFTGVIVAAATAVMIATKGQLGWRATEATR